MPADSEGELSVADASEPARSQEGAVERGSPRSRDRTIRELRERLFGSGWTDADTAALQALWLAYLSSLPLKAGRGPTALALWLARLCHLHEQEPLVEFFVDSVVERFCADLLPEARDLVRESLLKLARKREMRAWSAALRSALTVGDSDNEAVRELAKYRLGDLLGSDGAFYVKVGRTFKEKFLPTVEDRELRRKLAHLIPLLPLPEGVHTPTAEAATTAQVAGGARAALERAAPWLLGATLFAVAAAAALVTCGPEHRASVDPELREHDVTERTSGTGASVPEAPIERPASADRPRREPEMSPARTSIPSPGPSPLATWDAYAGRAVDLRMHSTAQQQFGRNALFFDLAPDGSLRIRAEPRDSDRPRAYPRCEGAVRERDLLMRCIISYPDAPSEQRGISESIWIGTLGEDGIARGAEWSLSHDQTSQTTWQFGRSSPQQSPITQLPNCWDWPAAAVANAICRDHQGSFACERTFVDLRCDEVGDGDRRMFVVSGDVGGISEFSIYMRSGIDELWCDSLPCTMEGSASADWPAVRTGSESAWILPMCSFAAGFECAPGPPGLLDARQPSWGGL